VLIAGGTNNSTQFLASAELFDPTTNTFAATGSLVFGRYNHKAVLLGNGKVLLATGGYNSYPSPGSAELYDPAAGTFTDAGYSNSAHDFVQRLANGAVLLGGGYVSGFGDATAELYQ